jgi:hypothetical protein
MNDTVTGAWAPPPAQFGSPPRQPTRLQQADAPGRETAASSAPLGEHRRFAVLVDRVGATASLLCAVHCMLLPFVLALLPLVGLAFLGGITFERIFVSCAAALAGASIVAGYRRHRRPYALYLMVPGIVLLLCGVAIDLDVHVVLHTACEVSGGMLLASSHITNLVLSHRSRCGVCRHVQAQS